MQPDQTSTDEAEATASGIMHCLRMLAEEAASLRLLQTVEALRQAVEICARENGSSPVYIEPLLPEAPSAEAVAPNIRMP